MHCAPGPIAPNGTPQSVIDAIALLDRVEGDQELLRELAELYLGDQVQRMNELREAMASSDAPRLARVAHGLKGAVANFCAAEATAAALALEQCASAGDIPAAMTACATLERALHRLEPELLRLASLTENSTARPCP